MSGVRFQDPTWLLLATAALPLAALGLFWFRSMIGLRRWTCVLLRVLLFASLAAALAGATLLRRVDRMAVIAVVDVSGSVRRLFSPGVDAAGRARSLSDRIGAFLEQGSGGAGGEEHDQPVASGPDRRKADDLSAVIAYDSSPLVVSAMEARAPAPILPRRGDSAGDGPLELVPSPASEGSNTAQALRIARAIAPADATTSVLLFTDGNDTAGDALQEARAFGKATRSGSVDGPQGPVVGRTKARGGGLSLDVVPLAYSTPREVEIESFEAPSSAPSESTVQLRIALVATAPISGELRIAREGQPVDASPAEPGLSRRLTLPAGRTVVRVPVRLPSGRVHRFDAVFTPDAGSADVIEANNHAQAVTLAPGRSSVLIVDGVRASGGESGVLARTLGAAGFEVESLAPASVPNDPLWFQRYDLIALENVPADALADGVSATLARYVTDQGGGLVMIGGPDSFGAGGWKGTPVEPILPVRLDLPERLVSPAAAVVIVIDCSGSMGFRVSGGAMGGPRRSKQSIANDGAAVAVRSMDKTDLVGVVIFNQRARTLIPLSSNNKPDASAEIIRGIEADGGTNLPPALDLAFDQLRDVKADTKHIIVLSDGRSQNTEDLPAIVGRIKGAGIRVSTIAVGDEADVRTMSQMAADGDGTYYRVIDPNLLPRIFLKAVRVIRTPLIRETPFEPALLATGSPLVNGLLGPALPPLNGLVLTQARAEPTVTYAMATPTGEPLLAHWNAGVGRVAAFTSDAHHWAAPWLDWPGYSTLWSQIVRSIARPQSDRSQELLVDLEGDDLVVTAVLRDSAGQPLENVDVTGTVHGPGGGRITLHPAQTGSGEYQARVPAADAGSYVVTLTPRETGGAPLPPLVGGVARSGGAEYRKLSTDIEALKRLADAAGGRLLSLDRPADARLFDRTGIEPAIARSPVWRWLIMAGIGLFLLDVASRRVAWDRFIGSEYGAALRRRAAEAARSRGGTAVKTVERLRQRDEEIVAGATKAEGPSKLSEEDARAIVRAQAERRKQAREAARATRSAAEPAAPVPPAVTPPETTPEPTSSLLEAKRRARRKLDSDPEPSDGR